MECPQPKGRRQQTPAEVGLPARAENGATGPWVPKNCLTPGGNPTMQQRGQTTSDHRPEGQQQCQSAQPGAVEPASTHIQQPVEMETSPHSRRVSHRDQGLVSHTHKHTTKRLLIYVPVQMSVFQVLYVCFPYRCRSWRDIVHFYFYSILSLPSCLRHGHTAYCIITEITQKWQNNQISPEQEEPVENLKSCSWHNSVSRSFQPDQRTSSTHRLHKQPSLLCKSEFTCNHLHCKYITIFFICIHLILKLFRCIWCHRTVHRTPVYSTVTLNFIVRV